ncbi:hypothetical protein [Intrasporangium calvum]|uniref:Transmembrane protein n=1 Tax=Intrasporangium calvum (strain ATCC 23552 / DSM 43043 / JCM 3097 / NBRC 12989 / NCIMB 10167 / NRRL B-3866 / 7 KIP) TaxID=710696 RepID=E6SB68_INTC7|nr:hypothetical protein [Intrasporangium calvum]ADU48356.1 hypothetical protein Intca_1844 [Intrasporangium calvum DSM 43043]
MKLYADTTARRTRQLLSDVLALAWVAAWLWVGRQVHDTILQLRAPADSLTSAGDSVHGALTGAGDQAGRLPVVGDDLETWLDRAAGSGTTLRNAGAEMAATVENVANWLGVLTALFPILTVGGLWLWVRVRFVRRATTAQRFIDSADDLDLFALRALANQPVTALARITPDPAGAWRRRDPEAIRALAVLELRDQGLRPPSGH